MLIYVDIASWDLLKGPWGRRVCADCNGVIVVFLLVHLADQVSFCWKRFHKSLWRRFFQKMQIMSDHFDHNQYHFDNHIRSLWSYHISYQIIKIFHNHFAARALLQQVADTASPSQDCESGDDDMDSDEDSHTGDPRSRRRFRWMEKCVRRNTTMNHIWYNIYIYIIFCCQCIYVNMWIFNDIYPM